MNVIHLYSARHVKDLNTHPRLATMSYIAHYRLHTICANVYLKRRGVGNNLNTTGYIIDETATHWQIQLVGNISISLMRGGFDRQCFTYRFPEDTNSEWSIKEVWPV